MRTLIGALCLSLCSTALAVDRAPRDWPVGERQKARLPECTAKAGGLTGAERKAFMSRCLKGEPKK
jgi:psiF repeat-containing protein